MSTNKLLSKHQNMPHLDELIKLCVNRILFAGWCTLVTVPSTGFAQEQARQDAAVVSNTPPAPPSPIIQGLMKRGVKSEACLKRLDQLSKEFTEQSRYSAYTVVNPEKPGESPFSEVIVRKDQQSLRLVSISATPDANCSVTFNVTTMWNVSCPQLEKTVFPGYRFIATLPGQSRLIEANPLEQAYLVPLPGGCLSQRHKTIYQPAE